LGQRVSRGYTNIALEGETGITLRFNASRERTSSAVVDRQLTVLDDILDIQEASIVFREETRVVRVG
jgi:hypothetical protein